MKPWWKSRILLANFIAAILVVVEANTGIAKEAMGPTGYLLAMVALSGINAILRFDTTKAIQ
jgi:hypothetical protein